MHQVRSPFDALRSGSRWESPLFPRGGPKGTFAEWMNIRQTDPIYRQIEILCHILAENVPEIRTKTSEAEVVTLLTSTFMDRLVDDIKRIPDTRFRPKRLNRVTALRFAIQLSSTLLVALRRSLHGGRPEDQIPDRRLKQLSRIRQAVTRRPGPTNHRRNG